MATEVAISFSALRAQLENEKTSLCKLDENIKKIVQTSGRFNNDRFNSGDHPRGGNRPGARNSFQEGNNNYKNVDLLGKRKQETKTVFSRLSARAHDSDGEDDSPSNKRVRISSAVSRELPTRAAVLKAQGDDEQARTRNRRIFGSLLGTLQKFKQEEIELQTKEDKKAQVEKKIEEQARLQKEKEFRERKVLFAEREQKKATIKALEAKMGRVQEFEKWEMAQKSLGNFILTKSRPHIYWLPRKMDDKCDEKLQASRQNNEKYLEKKREELQDELLRIENRCLRRASHLDNNGQQEKRSNVPQHPPPNELQDKRRRDKFAADADEHDDSDLDGHDNDMAEVAVKEEKQADTSIEKDTTTEMDTTADTDAQKSETTNENKDLEDVEHIPDSKKPEEESTIEETLPLPKDTESKVEIMETNLETELKVTESKPEHKENVPEHKESVAEETDTQKSEENL